jgi:hypothetical protein
MMEKPELIICSKLSLNPIRIIPSFSKCLLLNIIPAEYSTGTYMNHFYAIPNKIETIIIPLTEKKVILQFDSLR